MIFSLRQNRCIKCGLKSKKPSALPKEIINLGFGKPVKKTKLADFINYDTGLVLLK